MLEEAKAALGFAQKAGKLLSGDFACEKAIKGGKAKLAVLDASASQATGERYRGLCEREGVPFLEFDDMDAAIGRYGRKIAVVTDGGFARMIQQKAHGGVD